MKVRTVVTGFDAKGRSVFVQDAKIDGTPIPGIGEFAFLWNANEPATYPNAGHCTRTHSRDAPRGWRRTRWS